MHDEFRIRVEASKPHLRELLSALEAAERDAEPGAPSPRRVAVTHEDEHLLLYADSAEETSRARATLQAVIARTGLQATVSAWRWHPEEERWEDASLPLPLTAAEHAAEHVRLEKLETGESDQAGYPEWEVRVTLPTHHQAREFAQRLQDEGVPVQRHWRHLTLGARDEDAARELAQRLREEAPPGSAFDVEGAAWPMWIAVNDPARPFAIFGGLAQ